MSIVAARIDNRLLHGIVATQWTPQYRPQRVMVIDDEYANDPTKKAGMKMAKPAGTALSIITEETALANFAAGKYDDHTVFVITRTPAIVRHLVEAGQRVPQLVLGGTVTPAEGTPAIQAGRRAFVTDDQVADYAAIAASGTDITVQYVPADHAEPLSKYVSL